MIEFIKHLDFIRWHTDVHASVPQLPYIILNMLQHVLSQLASFSTNSVNNNLIEHSENGSKPSPPASRRLWNTIRGFCPHGESHPRRDISWHHPKVYAKRCKSKVSECTSSSCKHDCAHWKWCFCHLREIHAWPSPPGTDGCKRNTKKQNLKPVAGSKNFTKAGLFHCINGTATLSEIKKFNSEVRVRWIIILKELMKLELAFFFLTLTVHS